MTKIVNMSFNTLPRVSGNLRAVILTEEDHHVVVVLDAVHDFIEVVSSLGLP